MADDSRREQETMRIAFIDIREDELLAFAKAHIEACDCENHCAHYRGRRVSGAWDPTSCRHFKADAHMWCVGYEQVEYALVGEGGAR